MSALPADVINTDQRLDAAARKASLDLGRLRWHWTRDESNPDRVSTRVYADAVGRSQSRIVRDGQAYEEWLAVQHDQGDADVRITPRRSFEEIQATAGRSQVVKAAARAIADTQGLRVDNVMSNRRQEVKELIADATEAADRRKTPVEDEVQRLAERRKHDREIAARQQQEKKEKHSARWLSVEVKLDRSRRLLQDVLTETEGVEFIAEERELIGELVGKLRAVLGLIDLRITGAADVDWDAELSKLGDAR